MCCCNPSRDYDFQSQNIRVFFKAKNTPGEKQDSFQTTKAKSELV